MVSKVDCGPGCDKIDIGRNLDEEFDLDGCVPVGDQEHICRTEVRVPDSIGKDGSGYPRGSAVGVRWGDSGAQLPTGDFTGPKANGGVLDAIRISERSRREPRKLRKGLAFGPRRNQRFGAGFGR